MKFLTAGESHGPALVGILEGLPSGIPFDQTALENALARRRKGFGRGERQSFERDEVRVMSGVRFGKTLGSPVSLEILNTEWDKWKSTMSIHLKDQTDDRKVRVPRPGHADYVGAVKYDHSDMRNVLERASARETAMRVGLGYFASSFLSELGVTILSRVVEIGSVRDTSAIDWNDSNTIQKIEASSLRMNSLESEARELIEKTKIEGDTLGGVFEVTAVGLPLGLGSYSQWDRKLDGRISASFMSLNAIKGVEIGFGFETSRLTGRATHDSMAWSKEGAVYASNKSGGLVAGMTTGQPLTIRAAMKPLSTLMNPLSSFDIETKAESLAHVERSDVCAVPSAAVIGESLMALVLAEAVLEKFGGDSLGEIQERVTQYRALGERK